MKYDFDKVISRKGTHSTKWESGGHGSVAFDENSLAFSIADMDFPVAPAIVDALRKRVEHPIYGYTAIYTPEYKEAVSGWYKRRFNWDVSFDRVHKEHGVMDGIRDCLRKFSVEGDSVIIMTPVYSPFMYLLRAEKRQIRYNQLLKDEKGWHINFEELEELCKDPSVKVLMFCSPHNPVGRVWTKEELERVADICHANDVVVLCDEIHGDLTRVGVKHIPMTTLRPDYNIVTCTSVSKTFNLAGMEVANIVFSKPEYKNMVSPGHATETGNPLSIEAVIAAYNEGEEWLDECRAYIDGNFAYLKQWLSENLPLIKYEIPQGTYLAWIDVSPYTTDSDKLARDCGAASKIIIEQGDVYGPGGKGYIRWNLACPRSLLEEGLRRFKRIIDRVEAGDVVEDVTFNTAWDKNVSLKQASQGKKKVLSFLRYYGCPTCRLDMEDYKKNIEKFAAQNADVYCVLQSTPETLKEEHVAKDSYPFTLILDPEQKLYKQFAVLPALVKEQLVTPKDMPKLRASSAAGFQHGKSEGEEYQLQAVILLDENNKVTFAHYGTSLSDVPDAETVAKLLDEKFLAEYLESQKPKRGHPGAMGGKPSAAGGMSGHPGAMGGHPGAMGGHPGGHPGK